MLVVKTINAWLHTELPELTCSDTAFIRFHHKPRTLHKHPRPQPLPEAYTHRRDHKQIYCHTDCKARQAAPNQFPTTAAHRAVLVRCQGAASRSKQQGQTPTGRGGITRRRIASSRCSNCSTCRQKIMSLASSPDQIQHSPNATRPTLTHSLAHQPAPRAIITFGTKGYIIGIRDTRVVSTKYSGQIRGLSWFGRIRGDHALYISIDM